MPFRKSLLLVNLNHSVVDLIFDVKPAQIPICWIYERQVRLLKHSCYKKTNNHEISIALWADNKAAISIKSIYLLFDNACKPLNQNFQILLMQYDCEIQSWLLRKLTC